MAARRNRIPLAQHIMNTLTRVERELRLRTVPKVLEVDWEWASAAQRRALARRLAEITALVDQAKAELARKGGA
jgi:hypothetical protein